MAMRKISSNGHLSANGRSHDSGNLNGTAPKPRFPGIQTTSDGSGMITWVETQITQGACAFPITPTTTMGGGYGASVANGACNLWGQPLKFLEPESEHSAATACEGFAVAGGRVSNFTSGQGLVLMKEVLYTISGKRLPVVFHIGSRAITRQGLNVHAGHDDVMCVADCGWGILFAKNAQDAGDLAVMSRRIAEDSFTPILNVQDGFLTTHTVEDVLLPESELLEEFVGPPGDKIPNLFDPMNPVMTGVVQNQDSYMKGIVAQRNYYDRLPGIIEDAFADYSELTGRPYDVIEQYRMEDADYAIVGIGCYIETARASIDYLRETFGIKLGIVHVTCYRPFPGRQLVEALSGLKAFSVIERMDDALAPNNPLANDIKAAFSDAMMGHPDFPQITRIPQIFCGIAGLGSRDVRPADFAATVRNMLEGNQHFFVLGVDHDLTLPPEHDPDLRPPGAFSMRGHSVGGFGSVTTNKVIATIAGDVFSKKVQAYPKYGSEKKGLPTTYYLTVADNQILTHCELNHVDFVPMNDINAFVSADPLKGILDGGSIFVQTSKTDPVEIWADIPPDSQTKIRDKNIRVFAADAALIAREEAPIPDLSVRMQGIVLLGIFLKVTPFSEEADLTYPQVMERAESALRKYFGKRGEAVVQANLKAVRRGYDSVIELSAETKALEVTAPKFDPSAQIELFV